MNINKNAFSLGLNNRCHLCPQNYPTIKPDNVTNGLNKQMHVTNIVNNKHKIIISPSLPPR
jgi:hypothetical protein